MSTPAFARRPAPAAADPRRQGVLLVAAMLALMWVVEVIDSLDHQHLDHFGIQPRQLSGLEGVIAAPFLHASFSHLLGNSIPFAVLGVTIALGGLARVVTVTVITAVIGGLGTWLIAPSHTVHIGASGLVFGYGTYLIFRGLFSRSWLHLLIGVAVGVAYGTTLAGGLIPHDGISWQGHLFGGVGGVIAARYLDTRRSRSSRDTPVVDALRI